MVWVGTLAFTSQRCCPSLRCEEHLKSRVSGVFGRRSTKAQLICILPLQLLGGAKRDWTVGRTPNSQEGEAMNGYEWLPRLEVDTTYTSNQM